MYQYIYWHAQVWVVLLVGIGSCVILALLMVIALRRSHISKVLTAIDPNLDTRPLFFFNKVVGVVSLNSAANHLLSQIKTPQQSSHLDTLTEVLFEAYEEGRIILKNGWFDANYTLVAAPIVTEVKAHSQGVIAFVTIEKPLPVAVESDEDDTLSDREDWIHISELLQLHVSRPTVRVKRSVESHAANSAWQIHQLSHMEDTLLRYLIKHPFDVQSSSTLFRVVWTDDQVSEYGLRPEQQDRLRRVIYQLRQHIEPNPRNPRFIVTAHGVGYTFYPEQEIVTR